MVSTPGAKFGGADIKNMYLETPLNRYEYMQMPLSLFPQWHHRALKPPRESPQRFCLHGDSLRNVWLTPSWHPCQQASQEMPCLPRILWSPTYAWAMETYLTPRLVQPLHWWLWHQIHWWGQSQTSLCFPPNRNLRHCWRLERQPLQWHHPQLELCTAVRGYWHVQVCPAATCLIRTPNTGKATALPLCSKPYHIWEEQ